MKCIEPGCEVEAVKGSRRCHDCNGEDDCLFCINRAVRGKLCRVCAEREHPGRVFFMGRWRTRVEFALRIKRDSSMRGVTWAREGDWIVGREGSFEIRLRVVSPVLEKPAAKVTYMHGVRP